jgi:hypothetical protein
MFPLFFSLLVKKKNIKGKFSIHDSNAFHDIRFDHTLFLSCVAGITLLLEAQLIQQSNYNISLTGRMDGGMRGSGCLGL